MRLSYTKYNDALRMSCQILADSINTGSTLVTALLAVQTKYRCEQYYKLMVSNYRVMCFKTLETASSRLTIDAVLGA